MKSMSPKMNNIQLQFQCEICGNKITIENPGCCIVYQRICGRCGATYQVKLELVANRIKKDSE